MHPSSSPARAPSPARGSTRSSSAPKQSKIDPDQTVSEVESDDLDVTKPLDAFDYDEVEQKVKEAGEKNVWNELHKSISCLMAGLIKYAELETANDLAQVQSSIQTLQEMEHHAETRRLKINSFLTKIKRLYSDLD
ncbi:hypothetical protein HDU93_005869 [Gonapodya sp. JEL0774]|nr:hypothetical protein HDU93_005869 [Gonapodya sp. JEL0774]